MTIHSHDRIRENTAPDINQRLDHAAKTRIERYVNLSAQELTHRIEELELEWDIERVLELNAAVLAFSGLCLSVTRNRKWLLLPGLVLPFLFPHAVQGWCRPIPPAAPFGSTQPKGDRL